MVLTHTKLLSGLIIGTDILYDPTIDNTMRLVAIVVAIIGIFLCIIWALLLNQSLATQRYYRQEASGLEKDFKIFSCGRWQELDKGFKSIRVLSWLVIAFLFFSILFYFYS